MLLHALRPHAPHAPHLLNALGQRAHLQDVHGVWVGARDEGVRVMRGGGLGLELGQGVALGLGLGPKWKQRRGRRRRLRRTSSHSVRLWQMMHGSAKPSSLARARFHSRIDSKAAWLGLGLGLGEGSG